MTQALITRCKSPFFLFFTHVAGAPTGGMFLTARFFDFVI